MTIRVSHQKNYTCITNVAIRDKRLSLKARGLHHLLLSYPDGWKVKIEHLVNESDKDGRTAIASALQELERCGYLVRHQTRDPKTGRLGEWETTIREYPEPMPESVIRESENGQSGGRIYRDRETCDIINTDLDQITKKEVSISPLNPPTIAEPEEGGGDLEVAIESIELEPISESIATLPCAKASPQLLETLRDGRSNLESTQQSNIPSGANATRTSGAIIPARENNNQIQNLNPIQQAFEDSGKILSYGIEYKAWIQAEIGDVIKHYRQSGRALTVSPNDIDPDFKSFTAANANGGKGLKLAAAQGWIVNCEKDPLRWGELRDLVAEWLLAKTTGDRHTSIAQEINRASKPPIKLNLNY
ncbi:helix-turn-helix domain-containing protein [Nostoc sp.]|uniref:helix-turn-helix domain-containing protein n=1 Tax=Nostoc sp. TaxID=1180 RepID=UPI002FF3F5E3